MFTYRRRPITLSLLVVLALFLGALVPAADPAAAASSIQLSRTIATAGDLVTVTGHGFYPGDAVVVYADFPVNGKTQRTQVTSVVGGNGIFTALFRVPTVLEGAFNVTAKDFHNDTATAPLTIVRLVPLRVGAPAPGVTTTAGHQFIVRGSGFAAGEKVTLSVVFPMYVGGAVPESKVVTTDAHGNFGDVLLQVPNGARAGMPLLSGTGAASGRKAYAYIRVVYRPHIAINPTNASPGSPVAVAGAGFVPNVRVHITAVRNGTAAPVVARDVAADANGSFSTSLTIPPNAAQGGYTVRATDAVGGLAAAIGLAVSAHTVITLSSASIIPGGSVNVNGSGFPAGDKVNISMATLTESGAHRTLTTSATANRSGQFTAALQVPADTAGGTYTVVARSTATGRAPSAQLGVSRLAPSVVAVPTTAVPGTAVTVNGFGFAAGEAVGVYLNGQKLGDTSTNGAGQFSVRITIPGDTASGDYTLSAVSAAGRKAASTLTVNRVVSTHFYFASEYTGSAYHEYLAFLNPGQIRARVTITYQRTNGTPLAKTISIDAHTRYTEDVSADLGLNVSASAIVAADVPIAAERLVYHGIDGAVDPGVRSPSTIWYFADGNTGKGYHESIAVQNPNTLPVQIAVHFLPTHHRAFTIFRTMLPTSRTTVNVNNYVRNDAVGVTLTANGPVVANRTIFIHHGMTSKMGVVKPQRTWYFASGPQNRSAQAWIAAINPGNRWAYVTLRTYGAFGVDLGSTRGWLRPHARVGYLINHIAHQPGPAVVLVATRPIVAEQSTYVGKLHNAATGTFGVPAPAKTWTFAVANTSSTGSDGDVLTLFNPNLAIVPIVVQYMTSTGQVVVRTYVVGPLYYERIQTNGVIPNGQFGIVAASDSSFVALNRYWFNYGRGADTSTGISD